MVGQLYKYVGPPEIAASVANSPAGAPIRTPDDLRSWLSANREDLDRAGNIMATFIVDQVGLLRVAPRRTEHVACASGGPVKSAGQISFTVDGRIDYISNQSTGFCPEPESWPAVASALQGVVTSLPPKFSAEFVFRRCASCDQILIIKDSWFVCDVCDAEVPPAWNFDPR